MAKLYYVANSLHNQVWEQAAKYALAGMNGSPARDICFEPQACEGMDAYVVSLPNRESTGVFCCYLRASLFTLGMPLEAALPNRREVVPSKAKSASALAAVP